MKQLSKAKWIRLACFSAGGALLFYLVPLILMQLPDPAKGNAMVILVMFVNQVFMGVVGWHSNYFGKWGIYIPMVLIVLYGISEVLFFGGIGWNMEINYLQTAYIIYFLKRIMNKRQRMQEQKNQVNFPKGMGRKQ